MRAVALLIALFAALPSARAADALSPPQREAVEKIVHDYILQHPEILVQALQAADEKEKAAAEASAKAALAQRHDELVSDPTSPIAGNPNGNVTVVEFFDYRCPYCKQVEPSLEALLKEDGQIRLVYKEFPILGKDSVYASRVALAARKQGKYEVFHAAMMAMKGQIDEDAILHVAGSVGVDTTRAKQDMDADDVSDIIKHNYDLAKALEVRGTPAFLIGDELIPGAVDLPTLKQKIAAARKG